MLIFSTPLSFSRVMRGTLAVALAAIAMAWLAFVWPTAYRRLPVPNGDQRYNYRSIIAVREQRFTGQVEVLTLSGWHRTGE